MEAVFWRNLHKYTQDLKIIIGQVLALEHKQIPYKMCDSVRQKLGHTKAGGQGGRTPTLILAE